MTFLTTSCLYYHHTLLYYHHYINHHRHQLEKGAELSNLSQPPRTHISPDETATGVHPIVQTTYLCALSRQRSSAPSKQEGIHTLWYDCHAYSTESTSESFLHFTTLGAENITNIDLLFNWDSVLCSILNHPHNDMSHSHSLLHTDGSHGWHIYSQVGRVACLLSVPMPLRDSQESSLNWHKGQLLNLMKTYVTHRQSLGLSLMIL